MKISWITYARMTAVGDVLHSVEADGRYRVAAPVQELRAVGHDIEVIYFAPDNSTAQMLEWVQGDVAVLGKLVPVSSAAFDERAGVALDLVGRLQARGVKVIADINDNHFENSPRAAYFRELAVAVDAIVTSTPMMAQTVRRYTGKPVMLARDPCEGQRGEPRFAPPRMAWWPRLTGASQDASRLKLLWFGYPTNLDTLLPLKDQLLPLANRRPLRVQVVSRESSDAGALCRELHAESGGRILWPFSAWSLAEMDQAFADADLVVLPSDATDARKAVKSPNRLVNALWAGRFVIAHPLPAYQEFADFAWIGDDIADGVRWAMDHPDAVIARIKRGQDHIRRHYSAFAAAREWEQAIAGAFGEARTPKLARALPLGAAPLRLNLGCGDKILPGYVNVDVAPARAGRKPDVICDLRDLAEFDDDAADEILSVHVIEHFWRWEVDALLREWVRVLKPGGRMIVECPNLKSACETLLGDPDRLSAAGQDGETTMWVLYGDPAWQDPLMCHRWGYTPASLAQLMRQAGLVNVRPQPAQFKMREPRDMRVVGFKGAAPAGS